ncbi:MAG: heavy metal-associated domain-containing protein, partial [Gallionellaceae bacterium]|nr:heavy metal-associated domain-containing protein [Gallionellaceae bacterium]
MTPKQLSLPIAGMTCAACSTRLENNLNRLPGVEARVNLATETAQLSYDPDQVDPAAILAQVGKTGFAVPPATLNLNIAGMTCASCSTRL